MPSASARISTRPVKLLLIGDSGTGKTGSLVSLVAAGYKLRVFDLDNGIDTLIDFARKQCPDKLDNIQYQSLQDEIKSWDGAGNRPVFSGNAGPTAFSRTLAALDKWPDDGSAPKEWDNNTVVVIDSLTRLGDASFNRIRHLNPGVKEPRQWYGSAQAGVEAVISMLTADSFKPNVIICAHVDYEKDEVNGTIKGLPRSIGKALGPVIPTYFNNLAAMQRTGMGPTAKRSITFHPTAYVEAKTSAPFALPATALDIGTGLADFFKAVKGDK